MYFPVLALSKGPNRENEAKRRICRWGTVKNNFASPTFIFVRLNSPLFLSRWLQLKNAQASSLCIIWLYIENMYFSFVLNVSNLSVQCKGINQNIRMTYVHSMKMSVWYFFINTLTLTKKNFNFFIKYMIKLLWDELTEVEWVWRRPGYWTSYRALSQTLLSNERKLATKQG